MGTATAISEEVTGELGEKDRSGRTKGQVHRLRVLSPVWGWGVAPASLVPSSTSPTAKKKNKTKPERAAGMTELGGELQRASADASVLGEASFTQ